MGVFSIMPTPACAGAGVGGHPASVAAQAGMTSLKLTDR